MGHVREGRPRRRLLDEVCSLDDQYRVKPFVYFGFIVALRLFPDHLDEVRDVDLGNRDAGRVCEARPRNGELWFDERGLLAEDTVLGDVVEAAHAPSTLDCPLLFSIERHTDCPSRNLSNSATRSRMRPSAISSWGVRQAKASSREKAIPSPWEPRHSHPCATAIRGDRGSSCTSGWPLCPLPSSAR
jgi:hypothetical protein